MIYRAMLKLFFFFLSIQSIQPLNGVEETSSSPVEIVEIIHEETSLTEGRPFWVAIRLKPQEHWHSYWKNPGDAGMAPQVTWNLPEGFTASPLHFPTPQKFTVNSIVGYGYEGEVLLLSQITPPSKVSEKEITLKADIKWLLCSDSLCVPGSSSQQTTLTVSSETPKAHPTWGKLFEKAKSSLPQQGIHHLAYLDKDKLHLELHSDNSTFTQATFMPEESLAIDNSSEPEVIYKENNYHVTLKSGDPTSLSTLKGVLVLKGEENSQIAAEINTVIEKKSHEISLTEPLKTENAFNSLKENTFEGGFLMAILFAFLGGMILNLMPCVLPVISFKVFSFVKLARESRKKTIQHGLIFSFGVIFSFWILAGSLLLLQAYGKSVGWGFQLQEPIFVAVLSAIIFAVALNLFGVFEMGASLTNMAGKAQSKVKNEGLLSSFFSGILATAVATPCTGPFLGSAVGFAMTVPATQAMLIFTMLGFGMAFPYLLFSIFPSFLRFLPKPGNWMITFKEVMGFLMIATVLWLLWVFTAQTSQFALMMLLGAFFFLAIACWIFGKWGEATRSSLSRKLSFAITLMLIVLTGYTIHTASLLQSETENITVNASWETFSPERVKELQNQGVPVLIDFTAKWCLICQANHVVLSTDSVSKKLEEKGVVRMKADWTKNDPVITEELKKFGRNGVPLYVLYDGENSTKILPQVLTPEIVLSTIETEI